MQLHGPVAAVHAAGVQIFDLAGSNASRSVGAELRAGAFGVGLHTSAPHCTKKNCMYIAMRVLHVRFRCVTAEHHHLWSEYRQNGCVACPLVNKHGASTLFLHKGGGGV